MPLLPPVDPALFLDDGATAYAPVGGGTGYGVVSGSPRVFDTGSTPTQWHGIVCFDIDALTTSGGDESYILQVIGGDALSGGHIAGTPQVLATTTIATTGQTIVPVFNVFDEHIYRYLELRKSVAGAAPSIKGDVWLQPLTSLDELSLSELLQVQMIYADNYNAATTNLRAWMTGEADGGPDGDGKYPLSDGLGNTVLVECPAKLAELAGGTGSGGGGIFTFAYNPAVPTQSLGHASVNLNQIYMTAAFDSSMQPGSGGLWKCIEVDSTAAAGSRSNVTYRPTFVGAGASGSRARFELVPLSADVDVRQYGVDLSTLTENSANETAIAELVEFVTRLQTGDHTVGHSLSGAGQMKVTDTLDTKNASLNMKRVTFMPPAGGLTNGKPVLRSGRATGYANNKADVPQIISVSVQGYNTSTNFSLDSSGGFQLYDIAAPSANVDASVSRTKFGVDVAANAEKLNLLCTGAYCYQACKYTQVTPAGVGYEYWADLEDLGDWNASTNSPAIPAAGPTYRGKYYIVEVAGTTTINGISSWAVNDIIWCDGTQWLKKGLLNSSPDSNVIRLFREGDVMYFVTPDAADCSATIYYNCENRADDGTNITNNLGQSLARPGIWDRNGKMMVHEGWLRGHNGRCLMLIDKDHGADTSVVNFKVDHIYGQGLLANRVQNLTGAPVFKDCQNGRTSQSDNTAPSVLCATVQLNQVGNAAGFRPVVLNSRAREGYGIGDVTWDLYPTNVDWVLAGLMGLPSSPTDYAASATYTLVRVNKQKGGSITIPDGSRGNLDFLDGAQNITARVMASFVKMGYRITTTTKSVVHAYVEGTLSMSEVFSLTTATGLNWTNLRSIVVENCSADGRRWSWNGVFWEPSGIIRATADEIKDPTSNLNKYCKAAAVQANSTDTFEAFYATGGAPTDPWQDYAGSSVTMEYTAEAQALFTKASGLGAALNDTHQDVFARILLLLKVAGILPKLRGLWAPLLWQDSTGAKLNFAYQSTAAGPYDLTFINAPTFVSHTTFKSDAIRSWAYTGMDLGANDEGLMVGGKFRGYIAHYELDHSTSNRTDFGDDKGYLSIRARATNGAAVRVGNNSNTNLPSTASFAPHMVSGSRTSDTALWVGDNGETSVDASVSAASATPGKIYILRGALPQLNGGISSGATSAVLTDVTGITAGDTTVYFEPGTGSEESKLVATVNTGTKTITWSGGLASGHANNTEVSWLGQACDRNALASVIGEPLTPEEDRILYATIREGAKALGVAA